MIYQANEQVWERFRNGDASQSDLRAILADHESELAANPALKDCPDFRAFMEKALHS